MEIRNLLNLVLEMNIKFQKRKNIYSSDIILPFILVMLMNCRKFASVAINYIFTFFSLTIPQKAVGTSDDYPILVFSNNKEIERQQFHHPNFGYKF